MPNRSPNPETPVAIIRAQRGLGIHEFATMISRGGPPVGVDTLKKAESGRRRVGPELARRISLAVGIPAAEIMREKWTAKDRETYRAKPHANVGNFSDKKPLEHALGVIALYFAAVECGLNPEFIEIALDQLRADAVYRLGIAPEVFAQSSQDVLSAFRNPAMKKDPFHAMIDALSATGTRNRAKQAADKYRENRAAGIRPENLSQEELAKIEAVHQEEADDWSLGWEDGSKRRRKNGLLHLPPGHTSALPDSPAKKRLADAQIAQARAREKAEARRFARKLR